MGAGGGISTALRLFGTAEPPEPRQIFRLGPLHFAREAGGLRHIRLGELEMIRAIGFLVRDRDWGTLRPKIEAEEITRATDEIRIRHRAHYRAGSAVLGVAVTVTARPDSLEMAAAFESTGGDFETNRAGFTVLHPIETTAGAPLVVDHADGARQAACFPERIAPWQPFQEIRALTHEAAGLRIRCELEGDIFEMEDQRQWGDASFKTYNRPLALPWPYRVAAGEVAHQAVRLSWTPARTPARVAVAARPLAAQPAPVFPETALVLTASEAQRACAQPEDLARIGAQRILCHFDAAAGHGLAELEAFAALQAQNPAQYDLELIARCADPTGADLAAEFAGHAALLRKSGLLPASIMVCPSVDRQSTPPGAIWPDCPPLAAVHQAARAAFPGVALGGGMASFFPELNRKPPPEGMLEFVTHGLCPIVHAADDISVMENLRAVPQITRSARAIIGGRGYRLGPSTIAMRQNPYGSRTIPNPEGGRVCMTDDDPRHRAAFGAAWVLGLATAIAPAGMTVWTPAALYGPRGLFAADGAPWPVAEVIAALARLAGEPVGAAELTEDTATLRCGGAEFTANLTAEPLRLLGGEVLAPYGWRRGDGG